MTFPPLGVHTSIAGGLQKSLIRAHELGCTTVQIFTHNPRGWRIDDIPEHEAILFKRTRKELDINPVYVHCSYLINAASSSMETRAKSAILLKEEMRRAEALGADYVILHVHGSANKEGYQWTVSAIREGLRPVSEKFGAKLIIENTSTTLIEELAAIIDGTGGLVEGVCIDTCHAFAAGYDIRTDEGLKRLASGIKKHIGRDKIKLIHLNDSKSEAGTGIDRHEHIGLGKIGAAALGRFLLHPVFRGIPVILETPEKKETDDPENLKRARELLS